MNTNPYSPPPEAKKEFNDSIGLVLQVAPLLVGSLALILFANTAYIFYGNASLALLAGDQVPVVFWFLDLFSIACSFGFGYAARQFHRRKTRPALIWLYGTTAILVIGTLLLRTLA